MKTLFEVAFVALIAVVVGIAIGIPFGLAYPSRVQAMEWNAAIEPGTITMVSDNESAWVKSYGSTKNGFHALGIRRGVASLDIACDTDSYGNDNYASYSLGAIGKVTAYKLTPDLCPKIISAQGGKTQIVETPGVTISFACPNCKMQFDGHWVTDGTLRVWRGTIKIAPIPGAESLPYNLDVFATTAP